VSLGSFVQAVIVGCCLTSPRVAPAQEIYTDSVPGTLVRFEMVKLPGTSIWMGRTEVTWDLYDAFALSRADSSERMKAADAVARPTRPYGAPDYGWGHAGFPVISIAYTAAESFCSWLSARTGKRYRLPTESEWEQAASMAAKEKSLGDIGWHAGNAGVTTHPVGKLPPDAIGLHDLFGNAAEWVKPASGRPVVRGGAYKDEQRNIGPSARSVQAESWNERDPQIPQSRWWMSDAPFVGFRIVREP
jgi:formylglycine-generating enzyme required for sulfatase activity